MINPNAAAAPFPTLTAFQSLSPENQRAALPTHISSVVNQLNGLDHHITQQIPSPTTQEHLQTIAQHQQNLNAIDPVHVADDQLVGSFTTVVNAHTAHATVAQSYPHYQVAAHNVPHDSDSDHESLLSTTSSMENNPATSSVSDYAGSSDSED